MPGEKDFPRRPESDVRFLDHRQQDFPQQSSRFARRLRIPRTKEKATDVPTSSAAISAAEYSAGRASQIVKAFLRDFTRLLFYIAAVSPPTFKQMETRKGASVKKPLALSLIVTAFLATGAQAQATRTWVSGVGDDVNPCSRTAPCKTFAGAISKTAAGGEIDALDPGGFGAVTITKSITLDGAGTLASILNSGTTGININVTSGDVVTIRNLTINGAGTGTTGIRVLSAAKAVHIENCAIFGNAGPGISVQHSTGQASLLVRDSVIRNNTGDAITTTSAGGGCGIVLERLRADQNGLSGLNIGTFASAGVSHSTFSSNGTGITLKDSSSNLDAESAVIVRNGTGILNGLLGGAPTSRISRCFIANNGNGINIAGGSVVGFFNNVITDNSSGNTVSSSVNQQ